MATQPARAAIHSTVTRTTAPSSRTATGASGSASPTVLTTHAVVRTEADVVAALQAAGFTVRAVDAVEQMLQDDPSQRADVVLVDLDTHDRAPQASAALSSHRLVTLLARHVQRQRGVLVLETALDFAEIEDIVRAGVHAILNPQTDAKKRAEQVRAALAREVGRRTTAAVHAPPAGRIPLEIPATRPDAVLPPDMLHNGDASSTGSSV